MLKKNMKKEFSKFPRPVLLDREIKKMQQFSGVKFFMTAQTAVFAGTETLILNCFRSKSESGAKQGTAFSRIFCQKGTYLYQDLSTPATKWRGNFLLDGAAFVSKKDLNTAYRFLQKTLSCKEECNMDRVARMFELLRENIRAERLERKHQREKQKIDREMERFGEIPEDYPDFVKTRVFADANFIFYSTKNKEAHCTKCGTDLRLEKKRLLYGEKSSPEDEPVFPNRKTHCPSCGSQLFCKPSARKRGASYYFVRWSLFVDTSGEDVLFRYFCHTKDLRGETPLYTSWEQTRSVFSQKKEKSYEMGNYRNTGEYRWRPYIEKTYFNRSPFNDAEQAYLYGIADLSKTAYKYSGLSEYLKGYADKDGWMADPYIGESYLRAYWTSPNIEKLSKVGFIRLTTERIHHTISLVEDAKNICDALEIGKNQFHLLQKLQNPKLLEMEIVRAAPDITLSEVMELSASTLVNLYNYSHFLHMRKYTTVKKVLSYLTENDIPTCDYFDMIRHIEEMQWNMKLSYHLFPREFQKEHQKRSKEYIQFEAARRQQEYELYNQFLKAAAQQELPPLMFQKNGLMVRMPYNLDELTEEGEALNHCVGSYKTSVAKGKTAIFFIRKIDQPEVPFFTLEWNGRIRQCRGRNNRDMTTEVEEFVNDFDKLLKENESDFLHLGKTA